MELHFGRKRGWLFRHQRQYDHKNHYHDAPLDAAHRRGA